MSVVAPEGLTRDMAVKLLALLVRQLDGEARIVQPVDPQGDWLVLNVRVEDDDVILETEERWASSN